MNKTVVFDFDGVIHSYTSGWKGQYVIPDPPVPGIKEAIDDIRSAGYEVVVVSTRCASVQGNGAVRAWLLDNEIEVDAVMMKKPPAIVYIDDRAICFDGKPETLLAKVREFAPWYVGKIKPRQTNADYIRAMSDEELAEMVIKISQSVEPCNYCAPQQVFGTGCGIHCVCRDGVIAWLQQPAEEGNHETA